MSNCELPLTVFVSLQRGSEILGAPNQQTGEDRFGPPSIERSGSEHREGAVTSLALLERARAWEWVKAPPAGGLSPTRGTERVLKTIEG